MPCDKALLDLIRCLTVILPVRHFHFFSELKVATLDKIDVVKRSPFSTDDFTFDNFARLQEFSQFTVIRERLCLESFSRLQEQSLVF